MRQVLTWLRQLSRHKCKKKGSDLYFYGYNPFHAEDSRWGQVCRKCGEFYCLKCHRTQAHEATCTGIRHLTFEDDGSYEGEYVTHSTFFYPPPPGPFS